MSRFESVSNYRSSIDTVPGGVELSIPATRSYFVVVFLLIWLGGWVMGESSAIGQLTSPATQGHGNASTAFLAFWLCGWTVGGVFAVIMLLWNLAGRERILVNGDGLSIRREAFGLGIGKTYELRAVKDLRALDADSLVSGPFGFSGRRDPFGISSGALAFDYGAKTIRFGAGIDTAEAKFLLSKIIAAKPALTAPSS